MNSFYALLTLISVFTHEPGDKAPEWKKQQDHVNGRISRSTLDKMKSTTETLAGFLQDSSFSMGELTPAWHGEYFPERSGTSSLTRFALSCSFYDNEATRSTADLLIMANDISPMVLPVRLNGHDFLSLKPATSATTNCPYFEFTPADANAAVNIRLKFWLVSTDNTRLPYTPVTRKEYLQEAGAELAAAKIRLMNRIKEQSPVRSTAIQEAEKNNAINEINNTWSGAERELRIRLFLKNYLSDEDYLKASIEKHTGGLDSTIHLIDSLLHKPAADLGKAAFVTGEAADFRGFDDGASNASMLVRLNSTFANPNLSSEKPQFFLVCWRYNPDDTKAVELDGQFTQQFEAGRLRDFLQK
ncbi:MAG TPA: hypothetical protein VGN00_24755 [Puia sp.]|jgi:hypothetical protein